MIYKKLKLLVIWAVFLFLSVLIFEFFHECGHGLGSRLEGYHVSTGFNRVGDVGKRPSDPDFRLNKMIQGRFNLSDIFGPLINWIFAIIFTVIFFKQRTANRVALLLGSGAAINALMRLFPILMFFISALLGQFVLEDEVALGLSTIRGLKFPMLYANFKIFASTQPSLFLSEPKIYFWPVISLIISVACFILTYHRLRQLIRYQMISWISQWLFMIMPLLVWPITFIVANKLDNFIRLNW
jgi:hypothetical protein